MTRQSTSHSDVHSHEAFMQAAIADAMKGLEEEGGPFGACVVKDNRIIAVGHNTVRTERDPTCHAEINAIRKACKALNTHILSDAVLYTTAEPCPMCLAAIYWARIPEVYIGVDINCAAKYGFDDGEFYKQVQLPLNKRSIKFHINLLSEDCESVFHAWKHLFKNPLY